MCNCQTMARDLSETHGGRFPPSTHAPKCEDFKQLEFACIKFDDTSFIVPAYERDGVLENIDGPHQVETVMLTQDQFDRLPEWEGVKSMDNQLICRKRCIHCGRFVQKGRWVIGTDRWPCCRECQSAIEDLQCLDGA